MSHKPIRFFTLSIASLALCLPAAEPLAQTDTPVPANLNKAHAARIVGRYEQAVGTYEKLLDDPTSRVEAACGLAHCYMETGRYEQAESTLLEVGDLGRTSADWHRALAEALTAVGRYEQGVEQCRKAIEIDAADLQARQLLGELFETLGRRDEAVKTYRFFDRLVTRRLPADAAKLTAAAKGFLRYSVLTRHENLSNRTVHTLQELLQPAYTFLDRTYWPARLASADLLRSKFKSEQAAEDYNAALEINPNLAAAHVGLGRIALSEWRFEEAENHIQLAKERNPQSVAALQLEAALRLAERRFELAQDASESALGVNPNDAESLGLAAAAAFALDDSDAVDRFREAAYRVTSQPSAFHRVLADTMSALRQFPEAERDYRLAIDADPTNPCPRTELGLMYMQWGDEAKARQVLAEAWELDEFDARTYNTLDLLDKLENFATYETEHFIIRYDSAADALLPHYYSDCLETIHKEVCEWYGAKPHEKTIVEFFPTQRMFAVRITGKPWIHTIGACTGRVIALTSPRPSPGLHGPYPVVEVLRHEFTHTVTLAATDNRIPHWLTEGLAVLQERPYGKLGEGRPRSYAWKKVLAEAIRRDEIYTLETIDSGFVRPQRHQDRLLAYAQSAWLCRYIIWNHGYKAINAMLERLAEGSVVDDVLADVLGVDRSSVDADFAKWLRGLTERWGFDLAPPENVDDLRAATARGGADIALLARLAEAELDADEPTRALDAAASALTLDEDHVPALTVLGRVLYSRYSAEPDERKRQSLARRLEPAMRRLAEIARDKEIALRSLGRLALDREEYEVARRWLLPASLIRPRHPDTHRGLCEAYTKLDELDLALHCWLDFSRNETIDAGDASTIAGIYNRKDRLQKARGWNLKSLHINPFSVEAHEAHANVLMRMGETDTAAAEYEVLCELKPKQIKYFERAAIAHHKLGNADFAREFARQAVELDPASSVRTLLPPSEQ
jgi:tetratricopeptide (TPR) repeat protein